MKSTILAGFIGVMVIMLNSIMPQSVVAQDFSLLGNVSYMQKIALPQHAYLIVQLVDMSSENGAFPVVAETTFEPKTEVPINFSLTISNSKIDANKSYALQAKIVVGDILWFVSDERVIVNLNEPDTKYAINLVPLNQNNDNQPNLITTIIGPEWLVEDILGAGIIDSSVMTIHVEEKAEPTMNQDIKKYHVTGYGGCNRYNTTISINEKNQTLEFLPPTLTFMTCVQAITQQEGRFIEMLGRAKRYTFDDLGRLILRDEQGNYVGRLVPNL